ncbi:response regulator [Marinivivus vitaminiproducens]|uniref:response regulator n=1 Tax=Marinivivus vitaminiproducens TaxID=3035935 RepID=UPI0027A734E5|nr:response regulator [Geminicoccaceae bacterium SCSIO 64248]
MQNNSSDFERHRHILTVDDDAAMRTMIGNYLEENDFAVSSAADAAMMRQVMARGTVDLVILDLKLTSESGIDLLRELRATSDVPVILITGHRRDDVDRIIGLELGADDYILKPFNLRELLARIRAVLRRTSTRMTAQDGRHKHNKYRFAGWELRTKTRELTAPDGRAVPLTAGDFALLLAFIRAPRQILSREQLLVASRLHEDVFDRSIDVQILRLRRKLEANPSRPELITTVRGAGYMLAADVDAASPSPAI